MPSSPADAGRPLVVLVVFGTRPEAIKLAPVIAALRRRPDRFRVRVCSTGQHREMLDQAQEPFDLVADVDLGLMQVDQGLSPLLARALTAVDTVLADEAPDWLLVQGDTTTAVGAALAAFHRGVEVGHVEAGLRTGDLRRPFPEELNRRVVDLLAGALFAPTLRARAHLLAEGCDPRRLHLVGNTVVDALRSVSHPPAGDATEPPSVLVTVHRRESFGEGLDEIFAALRRLAGDFPEVRWVFPVHRNPRVSTAAAAALAGLANVDLIDPLGYVELIDRLRRCRFVLTDSGGLQEEAAAMGTPALVLREATERPEGIDTGVARLVGCQRQRIVAEAARLLRSPSARREMARPVDVYGDGRAAERIAQVLAGESYEPFSPRDASDEGRAVAPLDPAAGTAAAEPAAAVA